jgi:hypothetical protein
MTGGRKLPGGADLHDLPAPEMAAELGAEFDLLPRAKTEHCAVHLAPRAGLRIPLIAPKECWLDRQPLGLASVYVFIILPFPRSSKV